MRQYKIASEGVDIGNLSASKTVDGDTVLYALTSDVIVNLISKVYIETRVNATYVQGNFLTSSSSIFLDYNKINYTNTDKTKDGFAIDNNGHQIKSIETAPFTSLRLYFEMPPEQTKVYSELDGKIRNMRKRDDKKFELIDPRDPTSKSNYVYSTEEGLFSIEVERPLLPSIKISQVRAPVTPEAEKTESEGQ